jgi:hypothetical protein
MGLLGRGVLAIWNDIAPGGDAEFNHWHIREHLAERVGVPGFLRGRRYAAVSGSPAYFTLYETDTVDTLGSPAYHARLNDPTPWTRRMIPLFRNGKRSACRVTASLGAGVGGMMATLDVGPAAGGEDELRAWLVSTALPAAVERPGLVGAHLCESDAGVSVVRAAEKQLRDQPDSLARWIVLLEGLDPDTVSAAYADLLNPDALTRRGAAPDLAVATYRLQYGLSA